MERKRLLTVERSIGGGGESEQSRKDSHSKWERSASVSATVDLDAVEGEPISAGDFLVSIGEDGGAALRICRVRQRVS
jgi:hypothetical protein